MKAAVSNISKTLFYISLVSSLSSCATIFTGTKANIFIDGDVDEPVTVSTTAGEYKDVTLPTLVEVDRHRLDGQHIQISSEHHAFDDIVLEKSFNEWAAANIAICLSPVVVDLATNAVSRPKYNQFFVRPTASTAKGNSHRGGSPTTTNFAMDPATKSRLKAERVDWRRRRHEVNVALGFGPNAADYKTKKLIDLSFDGRHMRKEGECFDIFGESHVVAKVEYHYRLDRKWEIGAFLALSRSSEGYTDEDYRAKMEGSGKDDGNVTVGGETCRVFSFAPSLRYTWLETRNCRIYSRAAFFGLMQINYEYDLEVQLGGRQYGEDRKTDYEESNYHKEWRPSYQFSPFGMSVGDDRKRLNVELGYGNLGVCNIGLSMCF